jgi:type VI secretion system secreted protein Hcp
MAVDMFLTIPKVKGETNDDVYKSKDGIDILAWSWGMSQTGSFHSGGGGGAGKVAVQDISITKWVDNASANLMAKCANGEHYDEASLIVRKAGGKKPLEYIKIKLEKVMVTSVSTGGSGGEDKLTENITLNFAKIHYEYSKQKDDGSGEAAMKFDYDAAANKEGG